MTLKYGFFKAHVTSAPTMRSKYIPEQQETQYHMHLTLQAVDDQGKATTPWDCAINVGTDDANDLLRYRLVHDFSHPVCATLKAAAQGYTDLTGNHALPALDFLRTDILTAGAGTGTWQDSDVMNDGVMSPTTTFQPVASLAAAIDQAVKANADVYAFGRTYTSGTPGIHDIHMNQGSTGRHFLNEGDDDTDHNDVWQDGAILINYPDGTWTAYVTAFTQQIVPTDDAGNPVDGGHEINNSDPGSLVGQLAAA
jgi:uncharacterized protein YukJ